MAIVECINVKRNTGVRTDNYERLFLIKRVKIGLKDKDEKRRGKKHPSQKEGESITASRLIMAYPITARPINSTRPPIPSLPSEITRKEKVT